MSGAAAAVTLRDARALGYCTRGTREWCVRHGFDWAALRGPGLPADAVAATGDAMALRLVERARQRAAGAAGEEG